MTPSEPAGRIKLRTCAAMVRTTKKTIPLDPNGKMIELPGPGAVATVNILKLLLGRLGEPYGGKACLTKPDQEALNETRNTF